MRVEVRHDRDDGVERAIKKLKKKLFDDGRIKEINERRYFEKPSTIKRRKKDEAINRNKRRIAAQKEALRKRGMAR